MTDTILACTDTVLDGGREHMTDWQMEVNHAIKETGLSFNTDALLAVPTQICHIQRITSENQQLREELEAATGGARGSGDPGHGALRIAAQGRAASKAWRTRSRPCRGAAGGTGVVCGSGFFVVEGSALCPLWAMGGTKRYPAS
ncbi:hypothetical protein [Streptomyces europaeiscabiei]|nr:hypothetical protein [Streptomyces europaeiscabiei]MDX2774318.1 hypothetical protein [Streptomyces europaeiscabiei]